MNSGQLEGTDFESDICQLVSVEHFSRKIIFKCHQKIKKVFSIVHHRQG